jgi:6-pyruvoyltetrahydropterin/6-carboxytetrahydropterin synthase
MMRLSHDFVFSAAHHLPRYEGRCSRPHGHNYKLRVTLEGAPDPHSGMIIDFYALQDIVQSRVLDAIDHRDLNEILENPTAELIVIWIWERLREALPALAELTLWEVDECFVTYRGETAG